MLIYNYNKINQTVKNEEKRCLKNETAIKHPLLIVCYTNHALDQLLVLVSKFFAKNQIVRIGGRSNEELLNECNLNYLRKNSQVKGKNYFYEKRETLNNTIQSINKCLTELNNIPNGKVKYSSLNKICDRFLWDSLFGKYLENNKKYTAFRNWLGFGDVEYFNQNHLIDCSNRVEESTMEFMESTNQNFEIFDNTLKFDNLEEAELLNQQREIDEDLGQSERIMKMLYRTNNIKECKRDDRITYLNETQKYNLKKYNAMSKDEVEKIYNLWELDLIDRVRFYKYLCKVYADELNEKLYELQDEYKRNERNFQFYKDQESYRLISSAKVIGMTTTGASKHQALVKLIKPKIVIAEEAAEVSESHIIT